MADKKSRRAEDDERRFSWHSARERISDAKERASDFVEENPWKASAISAAVGAGVAIAVTALLMGRKKETFWDRLRNIF